MISRALVCGGDPPARSTARQACYSARVSRGEHAPLVACSPQQPECRSCLRKPVPISTTARAHRIAVARTAVSAPVGLLHWHGAAESAELARAVSSGFVLNRVRRLVIVDSAPLTCPFKTAFFHGLSLTNFSGPWNRLAWGDRYLILLARSSTFDRASEVLYRMAAIRAPLGAAQLVQDRAHAFRHGLRLAYRPDR